MLLITELQLQIHYTHCVTCKVFIQSINDEAFKVQDSYQVKLSSEVRVWITYLHQSCCSHPVYHSNVPGDIGWVWLTPQGSSNHRGREPGTWICYSSILQQKSKILNLLEEIIHLDHLRNITLVSNISVKFKGGLFH